MKYLLIARKFLGALTDALLKGRSLGLWSRKHGR